KKIYWQLQDWGIAPYFLAENLSSRSSVIQDKTYKKRLKELVKTRIDHINTLEPSQQKGALRGLLSFYSQLTGVQQVEMKPYLKTRLTIPGKDLSALVLDMQTQLSEQSREYGVLDELIRKSSRPHINQQIIKQRLLSERHRTYLPKFSTVQESLLYADQLGVSEKSQEQYRFYIREMVSLLQENKPIEELSDHLTRLIDEQSGQDDTLKEMLKSSIEQLMTQIKLFYEYQSAHDEETAWKIMMNRTDMSESLRQELAGHQDLTSCDTANGYNAIAEFMTTDDEVLFEGKLAELDRLAPLASNFSEIKRAARFLNAVYREVPIPPVLKAHFEGNRDGLSRLLGHLDTTVAVDILTKLIKSGYSAQLPKLIHTDDAQRVEGIDELEDVLGLITGIPSLERQQGLLSATLQRLERESDLIYDLHPNHEGVLISETSPLVWAGVVDSFWEKHPEYELMLIQSLQHRICPKLISGLRDPHKHKVLGTLSDTFDASDMAVYRREEDAKQIKDMLSVIYEGARTLLKTSTNPKAFNKEYKDKVKSAHGARRAVADIMNAQDRSVEMACEYFDTVDINQYTSAVQKRELDYHLSSMVSLLPPGDSRTRLLGNFNTLVRESSNEIYLSKLSASLNTLDRHLQLMGYDDDQIEFQSFTSLVSAFEDQLADQVSADDMTTEKAIHLLTARSDLLPFFFNSQSEETCRAFVDELQTKLSTLSVNDTDFSDLYELMDHLCKHRPDLNNRFEASLIKKVKNQLLKKKEGVHYLSQFSQLQRHSEFASLEKIAQWHDFIHRYYDDNTIDLAEIRAQLQQEGGPETIKELVADDDAFLFLNCSLPIVPDPSAKAELVGQVLGDTLLSTSTIIKAALKDPSILENDVLDVVYSKLPQLLSSDQVQNLSDNQVSDAVQFLTQCFEMNVIDAPQLDPVRTGLIALLKRAELSDGKSLLTCLSKDVDLVRACINETPALIDASLESDSNLSDEIIAIMTDFVNDQGGRSLRPLSVPSVSRFFSEFIDVNSIVKQDIRRYIAQYPKPLLLYLSQLSSKDIMSFFRDFDFENKADKQLFQQLIKTKVLFWQPYQKLYNSLEGVGGPAKTLFLDTLLSTHMSAFIDDISSSDTGVKDALDRHLKGALGATKSSYLYHQSSEQRFQLLAFRLGMPLTKKMILSGEQEIADALQSWVQQKSHDKEFRDLYAEVRASFLGERSPIQKGTALWEVYQTLDVSVAMYERTSDNRSPLVFSKDTDIDAFFRTFIISDVPITKASYQAIKNVISELRKKEPNLDHKQQTLYRAMRHQLVARAFMINDYLGQVEQKADRNEERGLLLRELGPDLALLPNKPYSLEDGMACFEDYFYQVEQSLGKQFERKQGQLINRSEKNRYLESFTSLSSVAHSHFVHQLRYVKDSMTHLKQSIQLDAKSSDKNEFSLHHTDMHNLENLEVILKKGNIQGFNQFLKKASQSLPKDRASLYLGKIIDGFKVLDADNSKKKDESAKEIERVKTTQLLRRQLWILSLLSLDAFSQRVGVSPEFQDAFSNLKGLNIPEFAQSDFNILSSLKSNVLKAAVLQNATDADRLKYTVSQLKKDLVEQLVGNRQDSYSLANSDGHDYQQFKTSLANALSLIESETEKYSLVSTLMGHLKSMIQEKNGNSLNPENMSGPALSWVLPRVALLLDCCDEYTDRGAVSMTDLKKISTQTQLFLRYLIHKKQVSQLKSQPKLVRDLAKLLKTVDLPDYSDLTTEMTERRYRLEHADKTPDKTAPKEAAQFYVQTLISKLGTTVFSSVKESVSKRSPEQARKLSRIEGHVQLSPNRLGHRQLSQTLGYILVDRTLGHVQKRMRTYFQSLNKDDMTHKIQVLKGIFDRDKDLFFALFKSPLIQGVNELESRLEDDRLKRQFLTCFVADPQEFRMDDLISGALKNGQVDSILSDCKDYLSLGESDIPEWAFTQLPGITIKKSEEIHQYLVENEFLSEEGFVQDLKGLNEDKSRLLARYPELRPFYNPETKEISGFDRIINNAADKLDLDMGLDRYIQGHYQISDSEFEMSHQKVFERFSATFLRELHDGYSQIDTCKSFFRELGGMEVMSLDTPSFMLQPAFQGFWQKHIKSLYYLKRGQTVMGDRRKVRGRYLDRLDSLHVNTRHHERHAFIVTDNLLRWLDHSDKGKDKKKKEDDQPTPNQGGPGAGTGQGVPRTIDREYDKGFDDAVMSNSRARQVYEFLMPFITEPDYGKASRTPHDDSRHRTQFKEYYLKYFAQFHPKDMVFLIRFIANQKADKQSGQNKQLIYDRTLQDLNLAVMERLTYSPRGLQHPEKDLASVRQRFIRSILTQKTGLNEHNPQRCLSEDEKAQLLASCFISPQAKQERVFAHTEPKSLSQFLYNRLGRQRSDADNEFGVNIDLLEAYRPSWDDTRKGVHFSPATFMKVLALLHTQIGDDRYQRLLSAHPSLLENLDTKSMGYYTTLRTEKQAEERRAVLTGLAQLDAQKLYYLPDAQLEFALTNTLDTVVNTTQDLSETLDQTEVQFTSPIKEKTKMVTLDEDSLSHIKEGDGLCIGDETYEIKEIDTEEKRCTLDRAMSQKSVSAYGETGSLTIDYSLPYRLELYKSFFILKPSTSQLETVRDLLFPESEYPVLPIKMDSLVKGVQALSKKSPLERLKALKQEMLGMKEHGSEGNTIISIIDEQRLTRTFMEQVEPIDTSASPSYGSY
ncbi:hypothetical protein DID77_03910, partial [Candidatus Marinamargulisbacteria bacterium SCGC AG-439-L15]